MSKSKPFNPRSPKGPKGPPPLRKPLVGPVEAFEGQRPLTLDERLRARKALSAAYALATQQSATSALAYLSHCVINKATGPALFREVAEPWQWALAGRVIPALESVAGLRPDYSGPRSFFIQLPRGHDKTSLIGRLCSWLLGFSRKPIRISAGAADKEQAGLIAEFMQLEGRLNPWLLERLDFRNWLIRGLETDSRMRVLSADDKGTFGLTEDVLVLDELTHWPKRELFNTLVSGTEKRAGQAVTIIITNAGIRGTWQHEVYLAAQKSPEWYVYEAPHHLASWMSLARINEMRKLLPAPLAKRVLDNQWIGANEESGLCSYAEAQRTERPHLYRREEGIRDHRPYYAAVDYGPVRDRTACVVGHYDPTTREFVVDRMDVWEGRQFTNGRVPIALVDQWIDDVEKSFFHPTFVIDPYNLESTLQRIEGSYEVIRYEPRAGKGSMQVASTMRSLVVKDQLAVYPAMGEVLVNDRPHSFADELAEVCIELKSYGFRLSTEGKGHDDRVVAVGMAAWQALQNQGPIRISAANHWF